jgi:hypothetical protein
MYEDKLHLKLQAGYLALSKLREIIRIFLKIIKFHSYIHCRNDPKNACSKGLTVTFSRSMY